MRNIACQDILRSGNLDAASGRPLWCEWPRDQIVLFQEGFIQKAARLRSEPLCLFVINYL